MLQNGIINSPINLCISHNISIPDNRFEKKVILLANDEIVFLNK